MENEEYKSSLASQDSGEGTLVVLVDVEYKESLVPQNSADRSLMVLVEVEYKASVTSQDSVYRALVVGELVDDVQGHPWYKINPKWMANDSRRE